MGIKILLDNVAITQDVLKEKMKEAISKGTKVVKVKESEYKTLQKLKD